MNAGGGYIEQGEQQFIIRGVGLLQSTDDIRNVVVAERSGVPVLISDVADVTYRVSAAAGHGRAWTRRTTSSTAPSSCAKARTLRVVLEGVKAKIDELNESILPKGVQLVPYYDRAWLIDNTLHTVFKNLAEGALLVWLVLFLFLGRFRPAAIVAVIIPLALLATFIGLKIKGIPGEPAFARRDGLRHHRRRRGDRGREHLPPAVARRTSRTDRSRNWWRRRRRRWAGRRSSRC